MLIGSLVELHVGLHSYLCFSHLKKLVLKAGSTPPQYLLDTLLSVELLQLFLIAFPIASRYLADRSRKLLSLQQLLNSWWIDRASVLTFDGLFLDTSSILVSVDDHFLDTFPDSCLDTSRYLNLSSFTEDLYIRSLRSGSHFFDLSLSTLVHHPNTISLTPNLFLYDFSRFLLLVSF